MLHLASLQFYDCKPEMFSLELALENKLVSDGR
jgi:hypothetical protein